MPIALAPAVLATLYRDLRLLKDQVASSSEPATVWAPFQILQAWAWERFPLLRPNTPNSLLPGEPRVARWHKLNSNVKLPFVRSTLKLLENFQWRPYAASLNNWRVPSFYKERDELSNDPVVEDELRSFARCLRACELVGLDCIEQYLPHRVALQFGMDQDLPGTFIRANSTSKLAWKTYDKPTRDAKFYVRSRFLDSNVTTRYSEWWKQSMMRRSSNNVKRSLENPSKGKKGTQNLEAWRDDDELLLSKRMKHLESSTSIASRPTRTGKPARSSQFQGQLFCSSEEDIGNSEASMESTMRVSKKIVQRKTGDSTDGLLDLYNSEGKSITSGSQEPGLEARLLQLERELTGLKSQMKTKVEKTPKF
ncbi:hypothetical protein HHK36_023826 [Tetracentron sinense]|uniref:Aminotransferase-like plant mobile domain-containing protein n=1 Tax=Tetracentron sinense TaxID=13715 RepID=A0A834YTW8_TETSI|nr:hypothetical protein HHK36_023826 [Tetracentron sinense]